MKYIKAKLFLCAALVTSAMQVNAQEPEWNEADPATEDQVQVAFKKVDKKDLLGGVSVVDVEELTKKNYNTYSLDNMQGYIGGWNGASLWGMDGDNAGYLVLVDGVPRDANNVMPYEIAQITFLKGANAVVLYGSKAAKGAILITTKRGKGEDLTVSVRANTGFNVAKSFPEYLGSAEYMTLYNEARVNDGNTPLYSDLDIYNHSAGVNPYRYTNIDYYSSDYLKKYYNRTDATVEISGGGKRAHFYSNVGYYRQGDYLNFGEAKNNMIDRFNVRGNVDVDITKYIKAFINANATFYNSREAKGNYWTTAATARPNFPQGAAPLIPLDMIDPSAKDALDLIGTTSNIINGKYFLAGTQATPSNVFADVYAAGSSKWTSRQFQFDAGLNFDLDRVTKGLSFNAMFAMDYATSYTTSFDNNYAVFIPTWSSYNGRDVIVSLTKEGNDEKSGVQNISGSTDNQTIAFNAQFNYNRTFDTDHNVSAMLIASGWQKTNSGQYHRTSSANLALNAGYNYAQRYYAEFNGALVHSAKFAKGHREALSPSVTLAWRLGQENFLKNAKGVDDLILSVSGSIVNQDIDIVMGDNQFYLYEGLWSSSDYGFGWFDGSHGYWTYSTKGQNNDLTFVKRKEFSVNLRGSFLDRSLTADVSFFMNKMDGLLINSASFYPSHLSTGYPAASFIPVMNYNANNRMGFDFNVNYTYRFTDGYFGVGLAGTYYDTKIAKREEIYDTDQAYRYRQGRPIDGIWGLQSAGLFQSQAEIDASPEQRLGSTVKPGDIKYVDQNNDGIIDDKDEVFLGKGGWYGAPLTLGLNLTVNYKGFTLFVLGTGGFGAYGQKNSSYYWIDAESKYSAVVRNRWTPETAATATYPRLSALSSGNNFRTSDFWMYKNNTFNLAKVQLTYDLPKHLLRNNKVVSGFSVYVSASNLLMISKERKHLEMNVGSAPQARFFNLGAQLVF